MSFWTVVQEDDNCRSGNSYFDLLPSHPAKQRLVQAARTADHRLLIRPSRNQRFAVIHRPFDRARNDNAGSPWAVTISERMEGRLRLLVGQRHRATTAANLSCVCAPGTVFTSITAYVACRVVQNQGSPPAHRRRRTVASLHD